VRAPKQVGVEFKKSTADATLLSIFSYLSDESVNDLQFKAPLNAAVHSGEFFVELAHLEKSFVPKCLGEWGVGLLMPSKKTLKELIDAGVANEVWHRAA